MEATGGAASGKPGQAPLLSPGRQILIEEEVITPPREGPSGPEPQGSPRGLRAVPNPFPNISRRTACGMVVWIVRRILDCRWMC